MQIIVAKNAGFCFGVKKAIEIAEEVADKTKEKIYIPGQLVHNETVIKKLEDKGMVFVENLNQIPQGATTVLRAHGEPGTTYQTLEQKQITKEKGLYDATCPLVTLVHNVAIKLKQNGYEVILFGKRNHPEAIGTSYHLKGKDTFIVEHQNDYKQVLDYLNQNNFQKVAIISQTTMSVHGYKELIEKINENAKTKFQNIPLNLRDLSTNYGYVDTICNPTKQRQADIDILKEDCDLIIVIGGLNSSNSKELWEKAEEFGVESYFIQGKDQLKKEWFNNKNKVGITAGASTPDYLIDEVEEAVKIMNGLNDKEVNVKIK